jgi:hypothetical protein
MKGKGIAAGSDAGSRLCGLSLASLCKSGGYGPRANETPCEITGKPCSTAGMGRHLQRLGLQADDAFARYWEYWLEKRLAGKELSAGFVTWQHLRRQCIPHISMSLKKIRRPQHR